MRTFSHHNANIYLKCNIINNKLLLMLEINIITNYFFKINSNGEKFTNILQHQ